uniref:ATP-dependent DNA helicase n=1 Tax=Octopus bimaculoides TaxID=37653 RepID=A0A0L8FQW8_OCTBM
MADQDVDEHPGIKFDNYLGRVYTVHPSQQECFYLHLLLHEVRGPTCFYYLKTFDGEYMDELFEDWKRQAQMQLIDIEDKIVSMGVNALPTYGLPQTLRGTSNSLPTYILQKMSYDIEALTRYVIQTEPKLLPDQQRSYCIIVDFRQHKGIALDVTSSGVAETLLPGGRTTQSTFKLLLNMTRSDIPTCHISKSSDNAKVLRRCQLIVLDECTMAHKGALEALEIRDCQDPLVGGVTLLLSGDFRQTLPVIPKGTRADEVRAYLKSSPLWHQVTILRLNTNVRAQLYGDQLSAKFAEDILTPGEGKMPLETREEIPLRPVCTIGSTVDDLKSVVFPNLRENYKNLSWLCEKAVIAPKNH